MCEHEHEHELDNHQLLGFSLHFLHSPYPAVVQRPPSQPVPGAAFVSLVMRALVKLPPRRACRKIRPIRLRRMIEEK